MRPQIGGKQGGKWKWQGTWLSLGCPLNLPPMEPRRGPVGTMLKSYLLPPPGSNIAADQPSAASWPGHWPAVIVTANIIQSPPTLPTLRGIQVDNNNLVGCEASRQAAKCVEIVGQHTNYPKHYFLEPSPLISAALCVASVAVLSLHGNFVTLLTLTDWIF